MAAIMFCSSEKKLTPSPITCIISLLTLNNSVWTVHFNAVLFLTETSCLHLKNLNSPLKQTLLKNFSTIYIYTYNYRTRSTAPHPKTYFIIPCETNILLLDVRNVLCSHIKGQGSARWVQYFGCAISQDFSGFSRLTTCRYTWIRSDGESGCSTCAFRCPKHWRGNARIAGAKTATALCVSTIPSHALSVNLKPGAH